MARVEKTVFISYRRKDISWALAVYQYLDSQKFDVFFDFSSLSSGDFEQVIISNIRARAHFVLILTPSALDRCDEPDDWIRREIETAIDEKRNVVPLFFDGFNFGTPAISEKLTGKLGYLRQYNGLDVPSGFFLEAMERLRTRYLNVPLNAVIHPVSTEIRKVVEREQDAANKALLENKQDIQELVGTAKAHASDARDLGVPAGNGPGGRKNKTRLLSYGAGIAALVISALGIRSMLQNAGELPILSSTLETSTAETTLTSEPPTETPTLHVTATARPTATPTLAVPTVIFPTSAEIGSVWLFPTDGMNMVYVPGGQFTMGSDSETSAEKPEHIISLESFWIDQTEVTNAMYQLCVERGRCSPPAFSSSYTHRDYFDNPEFADFPVIFVDWNMANSYCAWAGRRLPNEAEWEKAARGTNGRRYPWGDAMDCEHANFWGNNGKGCIGDPTAVGSYESGKSQYGAYDMAGNVWEWVSSLYRAYPYIATDGREDQNAIESRVMRGGSWGDFAENLRSSNRERLAPNVTYVNVGFRCAVSP